MQKLNMLKKPSGQALSFLACPEGFLTSQILYPFK